MYNIGQMAEMFDLPVSTLRYYDKEGLFPAMERQNGIRRFSDHEVEALRMIECLKKSGLEIKDIKQFMRWCQQGSETYEQRRDLFVRQEQRVEAELERLQRALAMIRFKHWYYDKAIEDGGEDELRAMIPDHLPEEIKRLYEIGHQEDAE